MHGSSFNLLPTVGVAEPWADMFILVQINDFVVIEPKKFGLDIKDTISHELNSRFSNKVLYKVGRCLETRINEHKLALRQRGPLSLVFAHALEHDHRFNRDGTDVIARANTRQAREFLEVWHSGTIIINHHVDLDAHYEGLPTRSQSRSHTLTTANSHSAT
nr:unnamed protein product [Spirometra erinaceieuropaei]